MLSESVIANILQICMITILVAQAAQYSKSEPLNPNNWITSIWELDHFNFYDQVPEIRPHEI